MTRGDSTFGAWVIDMLLAISSGLSGLWTDAREFVAAVRFARPDALWLLLLLPLLALVNLWAARQRARAVALIGRPAAVAAQLTHPRPARRWLGFAYPLAWLFLVVALAGPRWGTSDEAGIAVGRDLVIVIDLSRTMLADDMSDAEARTRWEAARAGALDVLAAMERRGGHRVALVVFAARTKLLCPLTTDYAHVRAILNDLDGRYPPPAIRPGAEADIVSGTRIGAGLVAAVEAHDPRFPGFQDIILISDGDDPGGDEEWKRGSKAARAANIPVYTVGVGSPTTPAGVEVGGEPLCVTMLQEEPLKQIAAETRGEYVAARRDVPPLGVFFQREIEPRPSRAVSDDQVPQPKERHVWFLVPALMLFLLGWTRGR